MKTNIEKIAIRDLVIITLTGIILLLIIAFTQALGTIHKMQSDSDRAAARVTLYPPHILPAGPDQEGGAK